MDRPVTWRPGTSTEATDGVFVDRGRRFYISDDLHISPAATIGNSLLQRTGLKESQLEHRKVEISRERVLTLLQKSLTSKAPLTEMFLQKSECLQPKQVQLHNSILSTTEEAVTAGCAAGKQFKARLVKNKARNEVMYAEIGGNTLDLLFSFLTIPLGSIVRLMMGKKASHVIGCMDNLYQSVEKLCATKYCAYNKLEKHILRDMLMAPKIATHFGCSNQLLDVVEEMSFETTMNPCVCKRCAVIPPPACIHGKGAAQIAVQINPKLGNGGTETGGNFAKGKPVMFMVTDEMMVMPNSSVSGIQFMKERNVYVDDVELMEVAIGKKEALALLRGLLLSKTPLTHLFCQPKKRRFRRSIYI